MELKQKISDKIVRGEYEGKFNLKGYEIYYKYDDTRVTGSVTKGDKSKNIEWDLHSNRLKLI